MNPSLGQHLKQLASNAFRLLLGSFSLVLVSAPAEVLSAEQAFPYHVINWQVEDGLTQNTIHEIAQTSDGYLWLATTQELLRFDGLVFRRLIGEDSNALDFNGITCLFGDHSGALWIGTNTKLIRYRNGKFNEIPGPERSDPEEFKSICQTPNGHLYVGTKFDLYQVNSERLVSITANHPNAPEGSVAITADERNRLWVAWGNTLYRYGEDQWSTEAQFPRIINSLTTDEDGTIWCGLNAGVIAWVAPGMEPNFRRFDDGGSIFEIAKNRRREVLFRISDRLHRFPDGENVPLLLKNREPVELVQSIFQDRENNLWLGTKGKGLVLLLPQPLSTYSTDEGLPHPDVKTIEQVNDNSIWLGTMGGGLAVLKDESFRTMNLDGYTGIGSIRQKRDGQLWVGTYGNHLWQLNQGTPRIETRSRGLAGRCLFEDAQGGLWVGGDGMGAERITSDEVIRLDTGTGLTSDNTRCFAQDHSDAIWIGTDRGLHRYADNTVQSFTRRDGLHDDRVQSLFVDSNNALWIGTEGRGLTRFQKGTFQSIRAEQGLFNESVAQVIEDDSGHLWLGTNRRLFRTRLDSINELFDGKVEELIGKSFGKDEGMRSQECSAGFQPNCLKSTDGSLWFCTANGVVHAQPDSIQTSELLPQIHIDLFLADGQPVKRDLRSPADSTIDVPRLGAYDSGSEFNEGEQESLPMFIVPAGASRLELHYTGINFTAPNSVHYRYRLENYDSDWTLAGSQSVAAYTHVAPGKYVFEVQAGNSDGVWNPDSAKLTFSVEPTLVQTWWFKSGLIIGGCITLFALSYGPIHRRRQLAHLRLQIARDLHDEVGSNLGSISLYSQLAKAKSGEPSRASEEFEEIDRTIQRTVQSLRDVIWFTNPKFDTLRGMLQQMEDTANRMLAGKQIDFKAEYPSKDRSLSLNFRRQVFLIFREIMHNIVKHSQAERVEISISLGQNILSLHVEDTGIGFTFNEERHGDGLNNMKLRAEELKGRFDVHPQPGRGTIIRLSVPVT